MRVHRRAPDEQPTAPRRRAPARRAPATLPQPQDGASTIASETSPTPTASSTMPSASGTAPRSGSRVSRSSRRAGTHATAPRPRLTKNTTRQSAHEISSPPSDGPVAAATPPIAPHSAVAVARRCDRELRQQQPERRRHQQRRARRLQHPRRHQDRDRPRQPAQTRRDHEQRQPDEEQPPPPEQIREPPRRHQQRGEDDVVGVQHPRQPGDRHAQGTPAWIDGNATLTIVTSRKAMKTATPVTSRTFQRRSSFFTQRTLHEPRCMTLRSKACSVAPTKARTARSPRRSNSSASAGRC